MPRWNENHAAAASLSACTITTTTTMNNPSTNTNSTMLAKDQTRLRIEKMEAERHLRRQRTRELRVSRAAEEKRNLSKGNPGDVDFIGLVHQWREEYGGVACSHDDPQEEEEAERSKHGDKICVCVRKRPLNSKERKKKEHDAVTCLHPTATVHTAKLRVDGYSKYCDHNSFKFDHAFDEESSTEDVYLYTAKPLVHYVCGGRGVPRATVFAYGQTGSGKTHTMGGIQQMVAEDVFLTLSNNAFDNEGCSLENTTCSIAIFEIYGGRIQDLLNNRNRLKVLEDGKGEVVVSGLEEFEVNGPRDFLSLIDKGHNNRTTHATEANDVSSRSHAICQILFRDKYTGKLKGKLSLVDLAGSERGSDTKSHNRQRRTESSEINTSLLALKECIRAIDSDSKHVPYRQSKLTLILKDCFVSKSTRSAMIATLSPGSNSTDHTVNTLRYADRIKEKKVGNVFSPSNRSPTRPPGQPKKSPVRKQAVSKPIISDERDDYGDDFDELEEIMNTSDSGEQLAELAQVDESEQLSEIDQTVKELFEEEEHLLNLHMTSIHENASLLTEEGVLLASVQGEDYDIDQYASRLGVILDQKTDLIHSLRDRLGSFRELLRKEEELSGLH
eukprot:CAMPEP_0201913946 /NCGR_PEP_ID=MMETSP0903-20130614/4261_1 /ASSEMBLY_ACC=CAM_ASM_000552 /TAXON_ID=420261 /ORGANISM="Thalassiosira antarctica, Strain CCMP982" /LENGTH=613 /DNA_ID=CAMNT_0048449253 /DNA_START=13 /DNA_END=1854 /DNA_ORIENTATION=-